MLITNKAEQTDSIQQNLPVRPYLELRFYTHTALVVLTSCQPLKKTQNEKQNKQLTEPKGGLKIYWVKQKEL